MKALVSSCHWVVSWAMVVGDRPALVPRNCSRGGGEVVAGQAVQVQQREHLGHLRRLAAPRRQDRRGEAPSLTRGLREVLVVHPWGEHLDRSGAGQELAWGVVAVADHQPPALLVDLVGVGVDVSGDFGLQGGGEHPSGPLVDELVQQRNRRSARAVGVVDGVRDYGEHGRAFPTDASTSP